MTLGTSNKGVLSADTFKDNTKMHPDCVCSLSPGAGILNNVSDKIDLSENKPFVGQSSKLWLWLWLGFKHVTFKWADFYYLFVYKYWFPRESQPRELPVLQSASNRCELGQVHDQVQNSPAPFRCILNSYCLQLLGHYIRLYLNRLK